MFGRFILEGRAVQNTPTGHVLFLIEDEIDALLGNHQLLRSTIVQVSLNSRFSIAAVQ